MEINKDAMMALKNEVADAALKKVQESIIRVEFCPKCRAFKGFIVTHNGRPYLYMGGQLLFQVRALCADHEYRFYCGDEMKRLGIVDLPPFVAARSR